VVLGGTLAMASTAFAGVLQVSDAERSWNQEWASWSCANESRVQEVSSPVAQGHSAYKLTVQDGDDAYGERCELGQGNPGRSGFPLFNEGDERWISFQVYLPDDYPIETPNWNVMFQIHQQGDGGCPPISLNVEDGQFKLYNSATAAYVLDTTEKWHAPAQRNRWAKFTLHIKNSTDDNVGFVEMFGDLDGGGYKTLMPKTFMHTMTIAKNGSTMVNHARVGIYRNPRIQGTASIYFDGFTIATDQASAEAAAFGDGATPVVQPPVPVPPTPAVPTRTGPSTGSGSGATTTATTAPATPPTTTTKKRARRVVLRSKHRRRTAVRSSGRWPRVLPVYGWVKTNGNVGRRAVIIEMRVNGRWEWLSRGWLRTNGRFYLAPSVDSGMPRRVTLRAYVEGVGYSKSLSARV
jgi:hypothetical protein